MALIATWKPLRCKVLEHNNAMAPNCECVRIRVRTEFESECESTPMVRLLVAGENAQIEIVLILKRFELENIPLLFARSLTHSLASLNKSAPFSMLSYARLANNKRWALLCRLASWMMMLPTTAIIYTSGKMQISREPDNACSNARSNFVQFEQFKR